MMEISDRDNENIKNAELVEYPNNLDKLNKWTIPTIPTTKIYNIGLFDLKSRFAVKTIEQTIRISRENQTIRLLTKKDLVPFRDYSFIHIGLIQIAFKPLTLLGLNSSIMAYVRDGRCKDFKPSLAALIETSLCHGPVYFDVSPNLNLSLSDDNLLDAMQLTIHTNGYNFKQGSEIIAICYRIYYKVLNTLNPKARQISFPGTTNVVQTNLLTSNIVTNRLIKWDEINFPTTWSLPNEVEREPIVNKDIDQIIQTIEGDVEIKFTPQRIVRIPRSLSSRYSTASDYYTAQIEPSRASTSRASTSTPQIREELETVETIRMSQNKIPQGIYQKQEFQSRESPTQFEMSFHLND
ncbi:MP domain-containing protein [Heracleum sosnowskyi]|uniref:MP domain-containing protein n=1 Tax=Heracleum sosnowskyi TaxID=360622 RepID=A0AAD8H5N5_9APIA|nr:MP domain-containing protein [Heracleum sosnowskyi]